MAKLEIGGLPSINEILEQLDFLEYSTQKRNLAYRIQFQTFLLRIYQNYEMYGSVKSTFIRNFYDFTVNILEYLLWIAIRQEREEFIQEEDTKQQLRKTAKELGIISKELSDKIGKIFGKRDKIHPPKQKDLDLTTFDESDLLECFESTEDLIEALKKYFRRKKLPPISPPDDECDYCCIGGPFEYEEYCPVCGEVIIH